MRAVAVNGIATMKKPTLVASSALATTLMYHIMRVISTYVSSRAKIKVIVVSY